ncbi:MupG family TIM beta-alpha barrel fold protein [Clostridium sp. AM58-1XD]|uniref:DUF871 domain-containing protein n=1 Tax=Clostridium sp. AM58-1XD TaxID=2292307 RepID=UPI000E543368|nr:MupG family TIM beta-alpha barrel fold protein [Clostridium sp. AM58-1XD]RGY97454.1 DUF871 domain-containing protein [Clostridium sp. AM58-1XD]
MARLGISIYPEQSKLEEDIVYIKKAGSYGFKRIFTCLLSAEGKAREEVTEEFRLRSDAAHESGMEIIADVSPAVFEKMGISYEDLSVFHEMHLDGIRLDEGFDGMKESLMTYNPQGLKVELNASTQLVYVENVMDHHPDRSRLITCHNFYPQKYSGISLAHFNKCNDKMKSLGLPVAAFISSGNPSAYGPWPVNEGLCTLEMHRGLPVDFQARHLFATGTTDDVIIANAYAFDEELAACAAVNPSILTFGIELEKELTPTEAAILDYEPKHVVRGDMSEYMVRSTWPRVTFAAESVPAANTRDLKRGDVVILNDGYSKYKGELHIVLKEMPNDGRKNVIGHIPDYEKVLLNYIEPWKVFAFTRIR